MFESLAKDMVERSKAILLSENQKLEDKKNIKLVDFYENRQLDDEYLGNWGFKSDDNKSTKIPLSFISLTRYLINKTSLLYKREPKRKLYIPGKKDLSEKQADMMAQWSAFVPQYDVYLKYAERYKNLLHRVLFRPYFNQYLKEWQFIIDTYYIPLFWEHDPFNPIAYMLLLASNSEETEAKETWYSYWSREEYYLFEPVSGKKRTSYTLPNGTVIDYKGKNPYGILPFVELRKEPPITQYGTSGAIDLVQANQEINIAINNIHVAIQHQSFGIVWKAGRQDDVKDKIRITPFHVLEVGVDETLNTLNMNPMLIESFQTIEKHISIIGKTYGVSISFAIEASAVSGISLIIQNIDLIENREDDIDVGIMQENKIYTVLQKMQEIHNNDIPEDEPILIAGAKVMVNYEDIDFPVNQQDELNMRDWYISNNIKTPLDYMDQDLDEKARQEQYLKNKKINGKLTRAEQKQETAREEGAKIIEEK